MNKHFPIIVLVVRCKRANTRTARTKKLWDAICFALVLHISSHHDTDGAWDSKGAVAQRHFGTEKWLRIKNFDIKNGPTLKGTERYRECKGFRLYLGKRSERTISGHFWPLLKWAFLGSCSKLLWNISFSLKSSCHSS